MNTPVPQRFNYEALDKETRDFLRERAEKIHRLARATAQGIVEIGRNLTEVRAKLRDDERSFRSWIAFEFDWSKSAAYSFIQVYELAKDRPNFGQCQIDVSSLYLIAAPKTPEPVRTEVIRRAEGGERVTHEAVVALRKKYEETGELPKSTEKLVAMALDARKEAEQAKRLLPSPAQARAVAITTGKHTLDNTGAYQPPMSKDDQAQWQSDWSQVSQLRSFLQWGATALPATEAATIIRSRRWSKEFPNDQIAAAIKWLKVLEEELWARSGAKVS